jgi:plasmid stability protein
MPDLLIRNLDPEAHRELKRRAERAGQSLQAYVASVLRMHVSRPSVEDWLALLDDLEPVPGASGSEAVAAARAELP